MNLIKKYPVLGSSTDASKLALTWKGVLLALVPILIAVAQSFSVTLDSSELTNMIESLFAVLSALTVCLGLIRKVYYKLRYGRQSK